MLRHRPRRASLAPGHRAPLLLALAAATTVAVVTAPPLVSDAEGCSGAPPCRPTGFAPGSTGVADGLPTDGWLRLELDTTGCAHGGAGGGAASIEVTDAAGAKVGGGPSLVTLPSTDPAAPVVVEWLPHAPFAPSASYTVTVSGLATAAWSIPFTTGAGAISTPVVGPPVVTVQRNTEPSGTQDAGVEVTCVTRSGLPGGCQTMTSRSARTIVRPRVSVAAGPSVTLASVERQFFDVTHEVAVDDGAYHPYLGEPLTVTDHVCVVTVVTHKHNLGNVVRSEPTCQGVSELDLAPVDNCCEAKRVIDECPTGTSMTPLEGLAPSALKVFERDCGAYSRGSSTCHGAPGAAGAGGSGDGGTGGGNASDREVADEGGGCVISSPVSERAPGAPAGLVALLACGLVWRRRR